MYSSLLYSFLILTARLDDSAALWRCREANCAATASRAAARPGYIPTSERRSRSDSPGSAAVGGARELSDRGWRASLRWGNVAIRAVRNGLERRISD